MNDILLYCIKEKDKYLAETLCRHCPNTYPGVGKNPGNTPLRRVRVDVCCQCREQQKKHGSGTLIVQTHPYPIL